MQLYRFSPIKTQQELMDAITYVHLSSYQLSKEVFGEYLENAGNIAIFSHYDSEYEVLKQFRDSLTEAAEKEGQKYFKLREPITISAQEGIAETIYTHLYIRQPDPYRHHVGDIDFYVPPREYEPLKSRVDEGSVKGARTFPRPELNMIELYSPHSDVLAYVTPLTMQEKTL